MNATIHTLPTSRPERRSRRVPQAMRRLRQQAIAGVAVCGVGVTLVALSLTHLAAGIHIVTAAPHWHAWAMAIGIDVGFIALEFAELAAATAKVRKAIERYSRYGVIALLAWSAVLNAFAFAWQAPGWMIYPAIALGLSIPALVYALTRVGAAMFITTRD